MQESFNKITDKLMALNKEVDSLSGKISLLEDQFNKNQNKLEYLKDTYTTNLKGIELLNFVQQSTKELIVDMFKTVVTHALQFIHQSDDCGFELEFGRRGNIPTLNFYIKTPDMQESHDIVNTNAGGTKDIVALALRQVLLEVSHTPGFLFLDEPEKRLDNEETMQKLWEFIYEIQKDTDRQIIMITHNKTIVEKVSNPIIMKANVNKQLASIPIEKTVEEKPKKRGRPKKEKTDD